MRTKTVFKSRWWALIWAAGIIWAAIDFAGTPPEADGNNSSDNAASAQAEQVMAALNMIK